MQNQIIPFNYHDKEIRVITDNNNEPWWVAKDVCDILEHTNTSVALKMLDEDEKGVRKVYTLGGIQKMSIINESGLYTLILRSNKPEAKKFKKWVTSEVLPSIRKTGSYSTNQAAKATFSEHLVKKLESKNEEIQTLKDELIEQLKLSNSLLLKQQDSIKTLPKRKNFTHAEDALIIQMKEEGCTYSAIAKKLDRTHSSVENRYYKLKKEGLL